MSLGSILLSMLWFFLFFIWIWLLIKIFGDIFRSEMGGFAKAMWIIFVIILPFLGVLVYLIANGNEMGKRDMKQMADMEAAQRSYIQDVAGTSTAEDLATLADLKENGHLTDAEYQAQKAKLLA